MKSGLERIFRVARDHLGLNVSRLHPRLARKLYIRGASVLRCNGHCCLGGTTVSVAERDAILAHAKIVAGAMTSRARKDPSRWFGKRLTRDEDFTVGRATFTRVMDGACVFYRSDSLCALQVAGEKSLRRPYALKPSVCILWPLAVRKGALEPGFGWLTRRRECCAPLRDGGERTLLKVISPCEKSLQRMAHPRNSRGGGPPR
jgi:Protein of unknown function (DUF3109)